MIVQDNTKSLRTEEVTVPQSEGFTEQYWIDKLNESAPKHITYRIQKD